MSDKLKIGSMEGLSSKDLERTLPGDLLDVQDGQHQDTFQNAPSQSGGNVTNEGQGGDRVWKEALMPAEKKALQQFFE